MWYKLLMFNNYELEEANVLYKYTMNQNMSMMLESSADRMVVLCA